MLKKVISIVWIRTVSCTMASDQSWSVWKKPDVNLVTSSPNNPAGQRDFCSKSVTVSDKIWAEKKDWHKWSLSEYIKYILNKNKKK